MTATLQRDQAANLAKSHPGPALKKARSIEEPWFRAQAAAWVARYSPGETVSLAKEAARAAQQCDDAYQQAAVRAWEIAALAEVGSTAEATRALKAAVETSRSIVQPRSKTESLILLLQAAARIGPRQRDWVHEALKQACGQDSHWRSKRALRGALRICSGEVQPRPFFW